MGFQNKLIAFQNRAERDFKHKKSFINFINYIIALKLFLASTLFAGFSFPVKYLFSKLSKPVKSVTIINEEGFENFEKLIKTNSYVLVDFWAAWCGPCLMMNPVLKEFAKEESGITVVKINADTNRELMKRYHVRGIPQLLLFKDGKEINRHAGALSIEELRVFSSENKR